MVHCVYIGYITQKSESVRPIYFIYYLNTTYKFNALFESEGFLKDTHRRVYVAIPVCFIFVFNPRDLY